jgi:hypothetical protein
MGCGCHKSMLASTSRFPDLEHPSAKAAPAVALARAVEEAHDAALADVARTGAPAVIPPLDGVPARPRRPRPPV